jgi:hypothetical protein
MSNEMISKELTKFDSVIPKVNELAKEFMPLTIKSVDDKDGYAEVAKALRFVVSKRTAVEEKRKELKADSLAFGRAVDSRAKEITAMLEPIETHLKEEKLRIDSEKERIEREIEEKKQAKINERIQMLFSLQMWQTQTEFIWKSTLKAQEISILRINLELSTDEEFEEFFNFAKNIVDAENAELNRIELEKKAEAERIEIVKKELELEKARIEKEISEMKNERVLIRNKILIDLGLGVVSHSHYWGFLKIANGIDFVPLLHCDDVKNWNNDIWNAELDKLLVLVEKLKAEESEAEMKREAAMEEKLRKELEDKIKKEDESKLAALELARKQQEIKAAEETERLAGLSDKEIFADYLNKLLNVPLPSLKSKRWQGYLATLTKTIKTFHSQFLDS